MLREICGGDFDGLFELYTHLHENPVPKDTETAKKLFEAIVNDKAHHIIVAEEDGKIVSSCVCVIIPNLTHELRPYALIENVVTDPMFRNKGYASSCLGFAVELAEKEHCYKVMLMTGSKLKTTIHFYERAGFNKNDKTAFIKWLK